MENKAVSSDSPQPCIEIASTSKLNTSQIDEVSTNENEPVTVNLDKEEQTMNALATAEEYLDDNPYSRNMLPYQRQMFLDIVYSDGLVICAKGISYNSVIVNLLRAHCDTGNLILVINSAEFEEKYFKSQLNQVHESSKNAKERELNYLFGGIQFITTRILVVDLLKKRIPIELLTGIVVLRAHQIIESCQEAFALRLYRQNNKTGFIKAFSNYPEAFTYGYGHVEKVMRNLFVKELFIWPRFHALIQNTLKPFESHVIELHCPMTHKMTQIQQNILDIMNMLVKEIKRINRKIDLQEITVENCLTKNFHKILQCQLDCIWHQISSQTKLLIADLKVLRSLMISTIYSDSVSFYVLLKQYRSQQYAMNNSGWILSDAADKMFKLSKERVFNDENEFEPEPCPKWKYLTEILCNEIKIKAKKSSVLTEPIKVLILCQDSRTCYQLNEYLTKGYEKYLYYTAIKNDINIDNLSERFKNIIETKQQSNSPPSDETQSNNNAQSNITMNDTIVQITATTDKLNVRKGFLRDRISATTTTTPSDTTTDAEYSILTEQKNEDISELSKLLEKEDYDDQLFRESYILSMEDINETSKSMLNMTPLGFESFADLDNLNVTNILNNIRKPIVCIQTFKCGTNGILSLEKTLNEMKPGYIIMYHCNVTAIRQIELYEAMQQENDKKKRLNVFFLIHSQTVEEQSYLTNLRREKQAFELLINTKSKMVIPEYQDGKSDVDCIIPTIINNENDLDSRNAGAAAAAATAADGSSTIIKKSTIIVDMREFRSDLPCLIHKRGIEVIPLTITIGDYILTPDICIERKSISDLIGSLNSGRLYNQCVQMTRYYKNPILLIEFDQNKPFHLQGNYMVSGDSTTQSSNVDITQKLQLLTMYFPKLRLVWSPNPYATAQLFEELKQNRLEPDPKLCMSHGTDVEADGKELDNFIDKINPNIYDFLLKLPGITSRNINIIIRKVKNLKELIELRETELSKILSNESQGKMLYEILHNAVKPVQSTNESKNERLFGGSRFKRWNHKQQ